MQRNHDFDAQKASLCRKMTKVGYLGEPPQVESSIGINCVVAHMTDTGIYLPESTSRTRTWRVAEVSRFKKCNAIGSKDKVCL